MIKDDDRIESICLNRKGISDEEGNVLIHALKTNKTVRKLQLEGNQLGSETLKSLADLMLQNHTLQ